MFTQLTASLPQTELRSDDSSISDSDSVMCVVTKGGANCRRMTFKADTCFWRVCCPRGMLTARPTFKTENGQEIEITMACCFLVFVCFIPPTTTTKPKLCGRPFSNTTMLHTARDENKKSNYSVPIRDARHSLPCCLKIQPGKNTREKQTNTEVIQGTIWVRSLLEFQYEFHSPLPILR